MSDRDRRARAASAGLAATAFVLGILGMLAFMVVYALGEGGLGGGFTQWLGLSAAVGLGGIGAGLVVWAHGLMPRGPHVEERPFPAPNPEDRREAVAAFKGGEGEIGRRSLLGRLLAAALGVTGLAALFPLRSLAPDPFPARATTGWRRGLRLVNEDGEAIRSDQMAMNSFVTAFPEGRVGEADSQLALLRVQPDAITPVPGRENWAPDGHVAYSKVCTHLGCPVGLYQVQSQRLLCPCHQSAFRVLEGAEPIFGPATRPLPQLPLSIDDEGFLVADGDFSEPIGPGFWTWPSRRGEASA